MRRVQAVGVISFGLCEAFLTWPCVAVAHGLECLGGAAAYYGRGHCFRILGLHDGFRLQIDLYAGFLAEVLHFEAEGMVASPDLEAYAADDRLGPLEQTFEFRAKKKVTTALGSRSGGVRWHCARITMELFIRLHMYWCLFGAILNHFFA